MKIDDDIKKMSLVELQRFFMELRKAVRKAGTRFDNEACWVDFLVICAKILPKKERNAFLKMLIKLSKERFLANCNSYFSCVSRLGNFIRDIKARFA